MHRPEKPVPMIATRGAADVRAVKNTSVASAA